MGQKDGLETNIREAYELVTELENRYRLSSDPVEQACLR